MTSRWLFKNWLKLLGSLKRSRNTVFLAFRIPAAWWIQIARYYYQSWPLFSSQPVLNDETTTFADRGSYRRAAAIGALLFIQERQIGARIKLSAIAIGTLLTGSGWTWLTINTSVKGWQFATISITLFLVNALLVAPAAAYTGNPWRRLFKLAIAWSVASVMLLAGDGWTSLTDWTTKTPSWLQVLAFATGAVALFCLFGALLARITFFVVDIVITRRRVRRFPNFTGLFHTVELLNWLDNEDRFNNTQQRRWAIQALELVSACVGTGLPAALSMPPNNIRDAVHKHFRQAAATINTYQFLVALPQPESNIELQKRLAELSMIFLTKEYRSFPVSTDSTESGRTSRRQQLRSLLTGLLIAVVPLVVIAASYGSGLTLPDYVQQWLTGFAIVWLIARVIQLFDPTYSITWERVHTALGAPRTPPEQP